MSYETEQHEYRTELEDVCKKLAYIDTLFKEDPSLKDKNGLGYEDNEDQYRQILAHQYSDYKTYDDSVLMLQYKILKHKKRELEGKLNESKSSRNISKTLDYIGSITPQHVSGRTYKVENSDGCFTFAMIFVIIDFLIIFIYYLATK